MNIVPGTYQNRRHSAAEWASTHSTYVLRDGEMGVESDTRLFKFGDGVTPWSGLQYPPTAVGVTLVNNLLATDPTKGLAASQGPILTNQIAVALNAATQANTAATTAAGTATTASTTATTASTNAATAVSTANAAATSAGLKANKAGDTFTGPVIVPTPTLGTHAATKAYVDTAVAAVAPAAAISTSFNASIPLDAARYMPLQVVSGVIAFTPNTSGAVINGECSVPVQADGTNIPTTVGFTAVGTQGYVNAAGQVNNFVFWKAADGGYYYGIFLGAAADITPPTLVSAVVANSTPNIVTATFSEALSGTLPAAAAFTVSGHTVSSVGAGASSSIVNVTVSSAFVNGEAARTFAYTQPGSNKLQDAAGNLTANFSGVAITNNVGDTTAPTVTAVAVANSSSTHVDITFSEAISSTLPAFSAFTVSGHTVSAITYVDATHIYLTVDAFTNGEVRTLAYTAPGTNNLKDLAGNNLANFSGTAITNNVLGAGSLSRVITNTPGASNLTSVGALDWIKVRPAALNDHKNGANLVTVNLVNFENKGWTHAGTVFSWTDGDTTGPSGTSGSVNDSVGFDVVSPGTGKHQFVFPAGTSTKTAYVWVRPDSGSFATLRATLSDGSATPYVDQTTVTGSEFSRLYTYTYNAASAGKTLTVSIETGSGLSDVSYVMVEGAAYA